MKYFLFLFLFIILSSSIFAQNVYIQCKVPGLQLYYIPLFLDGNQYDNTGNHTINLTLFVKNIDTDETILDNTANISGNITFESNTTNITFTNTGSNGIYTYEQNFQSNGVYTINIIAEGLNVASTTNTGYVYIGGTTIITGGGGGHEYQPPYIETNLTILEDDQTRHNLLMNYGGIVMPSNPYMGAMIVLIIIFLMTRFIIDIYTERKKKKEKKKKIRGRR